MNKFLKAVKDILFPADLTCDICGRETFGANICEECAKTLTINDKPVCPVCGRKTVHPEICFECKAKPPRFNRAVSAFAYEGGAVVLVKKFKEGDSYLKEYFADCISEKLKELPEFDCIVYIPMTARAKARRGYNQSELLAKAVSERCGAPVIKGAVEKSKETGEQKKLNRSDRAENLKGCFSVIKKNEVAGKRILVVDDVLTTGATADELAKTLLKAGAKKVYLATIASVEDKI